MRKPTSCCSHRGWTQAKLAAQMAITKRAIVSWETGERIPGVGMVALLLDALFPDEEFSLHRELLCASIVDDPERQGQRRDPSIIKMISSYSGHSA